MQTNNHLTLNYEVVDGDKYEFYSLGEHIVIAPEVCGGEPTFKYTRINNTFANLRGCGSMNATESPNFGEKLVS